MMEEIRKENRENVEIENETAESMEDYARELEASFRRIEEGDLIQGTVIAVSEEEVAMDFGYYAQGIIPAGELSEDPGFRVLEEIRPGDVISACVLRTDDGQGNILLSRKAAVQELAWEVLLQDLEEKRIRRVRVSQAVNAGVVAYLEGIRGFIPASQLASGYVEDTGAYVGRELEVRVLTADREKDRLVLSAKEVYQERERETQRHKISMLVPGTVTEGVVESLQPYGAFVALEGGLSGLVHISQISQKRIRKPSEVLRTGDKVKVKILNTDQNRISLSIKAVEEDQEAGEMAEIDSSQYSSGEEATTSLGDLFRNLKF